jgi:hypothetical protein
VHVGDEGILWFCQNRVRKDKAGDAVEGVANTWELWFRELVNAEQDVVEANEDEALRRACQTWERVMDEGTAWCCQYRTFEGRFHH